MTVKVLRETRTTYSVREKVSATPPELPEGRGVYYRADCDDAAHDASRKQAEAAIAAIRSKSKLLDGSVAWNLEREKTGELWLVASMTVVSRSEAA